MNYRFVNAQKMQQKCPDTFEAPLKSELDAIKPEDFVKISHGNERFWIRVTSVNGDIIKGNVDNDLIFKQPFKFGDAITLRKCHVYGICKGR